MQFVDKALARRFEACEEMPQVFYARVFQKTRPAIGAAEEEICGGHMIFAGLGSPIGRATGAGLDRPFTAEDVDRIEHFYRSHNAPSQVDLCPLHDSAVFEMFKERGYGITELNNVLYRRLDPDEQFPPAPAGCEIRRGLREEAETQAAIVECAFFPDGAPEAFTGLITPLYQMEGALTFAACLEGKMVACGTGLVIPEHRIFAVCGAPGRWPSIADAACRLPCCAPASRQQPRPGANTRSWSRRVEPYRNAIASCWAFAWPTVR